MEGIAFGIITLENLKKTMTRGEYNIGF